MGYPVCWLFTCVYRQQSDFSQLTALKMRNAKALLVCLLVAMLLPGGQADCNCRHNGDAERWDDSDSPAGRLGAICSMHTCYQAQSGTMCVTGDASQCNCAIAAAGNWQSWSRNWWLWSAITCDGPAGTLSVTITWVSSVEYVRKKFPSQLYNNPAALRAPEYENCTGVCFI
jgi:hypothetical protein